MVRHPVAPKPGKYPDNVGKKEVALQKAERVARNLPGPTVVACVASSGYRRVVLTIFRYTFSWC